MASLLEQERIVVESPDKSNDPEMHRLRTPEDDAVTGSDEPAVAQAASVFCEKPALRVVTGGTGPHEVAVEARS